MSSEYPYSIFSANGDRIDNAITEKGAIQFAIYHATETGAVVRYCRDGGVSQFVTVIDGVPRFQGGFDFEAPQKSPRGRPKKSDSMSNAERQAKFRARRRAVPVGDRISATISRFAKDFDLSEDEITRQLLRFALCNRNWGQTGFLSPGNEKSDDVL